MTSTMVERLGAGRYVDRDAVPDCATVSLHELSTVDGAKTSGVLYEVPGADTVVSLTHPWQDLTHHPLVPILLRRGYSVWTQASRSVNNDLTLVHEQAILDVAAGMVFLRDRGFESLVTLGHSGGGTLYAFYIEQAGLPASQRIAKTPAGRATRLAEADMPLPDGAVFLAPHPGQGTLLLACIDASVADESDPLSVVPELDPYHPANGFAEPPQSSHYRDDYLASYRQAQRDRVACVDAIARQRVAEAAEARARFKRTGRARRIGGPPWRRG
jgi:hypothetical protein